MKSAEELREQFLNSLKYCLHCEKTGHKTIECWSTHGLNTARDIELHQLCAAATAQAKPVGQVRYSKDIGWHIRAIKAWSKLGDGTYLYTGPSADPKEPS